MYGSRSIVELKDELRKRGAKLSGRKHELVDRLEAYDRNFNFGYDGSVVADDYHMIVPDAGTYKDINSDSKIPDVTVLNVQNFLGLFDQVVQKKSSDLYFGRFIQTIRYSQSSSSTYIKARVSAEMTKNCVYCVDILLDVHGVVSESQCECTAGAGPSAHCKHVAVVLFALTKQKDGIITKETCTQTLQTFHQVKSYGGSPVKMQHLKIRNDASLQALAEFDPRPEELRMDVRYPHQFRNVLINSRITNASLRQHFAPANLLAYQHDYEFYAKYSPENHFLMSSGITQISEHECEEIELKTRGQAKNKIWLQERTKRLHASNYGRLCLATDRTNFVNLAQSLTKVSSFDSAAVAHGRKYESVAATQYSSVTGLTVTHCGIVVSRQHPFLACSPDGLVGCDGVIEIKCPYSARHCSISPDSISYVTEDQHGILRLRSKHEYYHQVQGVLLCTGRSWCDFVVWTHCDMKVVRLARNEEFMTEMLLKLEHFFSDYFRAALLNKYFYRCR